MHLTQRIAIRYLRTKFKILSAISKRKAAEQAFALFTTPQNRTLGKIPEIFRQAEKISFSFQDQTITGYRWNYPNEKKVLILHGFESSIINFEKYIKPLINSGFEVLAFDAPAHGLSTGKSITVLVYKDFIHHIYQNFGPIKSFIAHSFGGLALSIFLEEIPHDNSYKAALIAPATETTTSIEYFFRLLNLDSDLRTEFDNLIKELGNHLPEWFSIKRAAEHIKASILWLHDKEDHITPLKDMQPVMQRKYPNFRFIISSGLGHRIIYRNSHSINSVIDFLNGKRNKQEKE